MTFSNGNTDLKDCSDIFHILKVSSVGIPNYKYNYEFNMILFIPFRLNVYPIVLQYE